MTAAVIVSIQKFSVHDGPGIRTTIFFKGCPLTCQWCHNPESQKAGKELVLHSARCTLCGQCQKNCRQQAIRIAGNRLSYDQSNCTYCERCIDHCYNEAREFVGKEVTVEELMVEIEKDRPFYEQSGGGVTLSGGEAMTQIDFVEELVTCCNEQGISVAVDTCGYAPRENFIRIMKQINVFLYDIKLMDPALHSQYTGRDNLLILENLELLSRNGAVINIRLPLLEGINTEDSHIQSIIDFISRLAIRSINLLPYHDMAKGKYGKLHLDYSAAAFSSPAEERLKEIQKMFEQANYQVKIGG
jgi:pyruvate formate lyase activating enzyme